MRLGNAEEIEVRREVELHGWMDLGSVLHNGGRDVARKYREICCSSRLPETVGVGQKIEEVQYFSVLLVAPV